ncbi:hypothetical protein [Gordonia insulae]|uniref:PD-(D/E)XK endonuclease-like domain-containing protein n=1 Tax=Gordonia insulae TaxID=2420509 RepID=A0A3G8JEG5_9ACTN|nr:hypothetical protein [Gordonia insulae]AZG43477.1 hypothetical protein D7316_00042 [Gordonia insulae]
MTAAEALDQLAAAPDPLLDDLKQLIIDGSAGEERSQQRDLGPSEVGHPCLRKLALGLIHAPKVNVYDDPLPSVVGTGAHAQLEEFARRANARLGRTRWLPETRVTIRQGLAGTCDLVDLDSATVIDWKFPGQSKMSTYTNHGPSEQYRRQAHLYGRGMRNIGIPIERVGIAFMPRGGQMKHAHLWTEPYSDAVVDETLTRIDTAMALMWDLQVDDKPENWSLIPTKPVDCFVCPYNRRSPDSPLQCDGKTTTAKVAAAQ